MTTQVASESLRSGTGVGPSAPGIAQHLFSPLLRALEHDAGIDRRAAVIDRVAGPLGRSAIAPTLRGRQIGHALHPLLTDLPLGCWTSALLLDMVGGRAGRPAARRLTGIGLIGVVPAALSGLVEFDGLERRPDRRVATAHAVGNSIAAGCQLLSWRARRRRRQARGIWWGLMGNSVAAASGYLGGHLAFARAVGAGERGETEPIGAPASRSGPDESVVRPFG